ncbi:hypothetical protein T229_15585 [Tannerella sp. oral taxon BU063 isolate Cell 5]|uniref:Uncharacterized protein n=1 Tax=Tannerella sp. oral taxon BU063 isolate Cell 5 TaxID=1410950 RepID=W2C9R5_9BACT|nr:hypothetical protein T229_15585 [Tannerella sp. oral taxon BU063 isolate Cell 5]
MFLMILFHHLTSIASYVRMNDETKGQKQVLIDPKQKRERSAQTIPLNNHPINSKQLLISPVTPQLRRMAPTAILVLLQPSQTPVDMRG